ncbi:hypothetical protein G6F70_007405 [Rhizopus microsporus]|uniref:L domain-like protein n=2 Tax=Rhizopus TaxID=4842 RepID=A0A367JXK1_RHIAZ|nr:hypothetical protein G6F71_002983 [Rhizopus microsporus]RCH94391.1 hypothetical protein CU097_013004 [Rhizopus azygosporus]KAG1196494.1 hypothetical protein G6F70_007405 [Rhizopus microsporus]KAG1208220.1 hypothetical protein G6F69_007405 [Rhizopus microsporus]KAG1230050.1 hypothetical protein G6F67_006728 [Rhizopus microsporus]
MGQHTSREHAPLTFGYINDPSRLNKQKESISEEGTSEEQKDPVLTNPHLYRLQAICDQCHQEKNKEQMIVSVLGEPCSTCQGQKRLSLVRRDLAEDLEYIDQTYYPDLVHYNSTINDPMETELLELDDEPNRQWSRLTIGDVTPTRRRQRRLTGPSMSVDLSGRCLVKLSPTIGYLDNLTKLNLSNNQMTELPKEVGYLKNLTVLNISENKLVELPDTIAFLSKLKALNVSHNQLSTLPPSIGQLRKLVIIIANNNQLAHLPKEISELSKLVSLNLSFNPLKSLPAEIATLTTLRKLLTEECPFEDEYTYDLPHDPPSLLETCARIAVKHEIDIPNHLASHIKDYLARASKCSYCHGPYFDNYITRFRFIERTARHTVALEYKLCSAHWSNDNDRLLAMFSHSSHNSRDHDVDTEGLNEEVHMTRRNRAYSDSSSLTGYLTPPFISTPNSEQSVDYFSLPSSSLSTTPISRLKSKPSLPALPAQKEYRNRPRASSSASVTKRFTNFIRSNSSTSIKQRERSQSGSCLQEGGSSSSSTSSSSNPSLAALDDNNEILPFHRRQLHTKKGLREWTDNIQMATAAATSTILSDNPPDDDNEQITSIIRNNSIATIVSKT